MAFLIFRPWFLYSCTVSKALFRHSHIPCIVKMLTVCIRLFSRPPSVLVWYFQTHRLCRGHSWSRETAGKLPEYSSHLKHLKGFFTSPQINSSQCDPASKTCILITFLKQVLFYFNFIWSLRNFVVYLEFLVVFIACISI